MDSDELEWQAWVARNVGELLAYTPNLAEAPKRDGVALSLSICIAQTTEGNLTEFARRLGFLKSAVSQWCSGKAVPQLSVILKICRALNVTLIDFLINPTLLDQTKLIGTNSANSQRKSQQIKRQLETAHLQQALQSAL